MDKAITISILNEALARQTVMIFDRMDQKLAEQTDYILAEVDKRIDERIVISTNSIIADISEQLVDMMTHIDKRFDTLERIVTGTVKRVNSHEGRISKLEKITS